MRGSLFLSVPAPRTPRPRARTTRPLAARLLPLLLALVAAGCPHPASPVVSADPTSDLGPPDAFGVRAGPDYVFVPRAALVHATLPPSFLVVDGAVQLRRDWTGLLGAMGLRRGDTVRACAGEPVTDIAAVDRCFAHFYTSPDLALTFERNAAPRDVRLVFDGPALPPPPYAFVSGDRQPPPADARSLDLAATYGLARSGTSARMPRGALVRVFDDHVLVRPLRANGAIVAYDVASPVLAALGWSGATARVDELALTSDEAATVALRRLLTADRVVVTPADGSLPLTITIEGAPTAPPPLWAPTVLVDAREAQLRAGVRFEGEHRYVPRGALGSLDSVARMDAPRQDVPVEDLARPVDVLRAFGPAIADVLALPWAATIERADGVPIYGATGLTALRRRLLTGDEVTLELGGARPTRVVVHVEGAPIALPDGWPARRRGAPAPADDPPDPRFVREGDTVRMSRLALRSMFVDPLTGHRTRDGLRLGPNMLWHVLDVPMGAALASADGQPATDPTSLDDLGTRLCTVPEVTLTFQNNGETFTRVVQIDGPPVTPP